MKIVYLGHSCFQIISDLGTKIITDPFTGVGYAMQRVETDIVTVSHGHSDHNYLPAISSYELLASKAEKYVYKDVSLQGIECFHDPLQGRLRGKNIIFKMEVDGLTVCHLGDLGEPCHKDILEKIGEADILLLPIGGTYTIDAKQAKEYVESIAPKAVIPMHYRPEDGTLNVSTAEDFLKLYGQDEVQTFQGELSLSEKDLERGKTHILYMERRK